MKDLSKNIDVNTYDNLEIYKICLHFIDLKSKLLMERKVKFLVSTNGAFNFCIIYSKATLWT